jgi:hypothetical protein
LKGSDLNEENLDSIYKMMTKHSVALPIEDLSKKVYVGLDSILREKVRIEFIK